MTAEQYNNVIKCTVKKVDFPKTADSFQEARAIFKNLGVALPQGNGGEVLTALQTNDYMGWRSCTREEAQRYANNGIATIGISKDRIVVLTASVEEDETEEPIAVGTPTVMTLSSESSEDVVSDLAFFAYNYGGTTTGSSTGTTGSVQQYRDAYTYQLVHMFGFSESTALLIRSLYDKVDQKFPSDSELIKAWKCARLLGGFEYGNEDPKFRVMNIMKTMWELLWHITSGQVCESTEKDYFTSLLQYTESEYIELKNEIQAKHTGYNGCDFAHLQMSLSARLAYRLNQDGFAPPRGSFCSERDHSYLGGWLGDAVISLNGPPSMSDADYCADLDAENIYHFILNKGSSISALNYYFSTVPHTFVTRTDLFLNYLSYDFVEQKVLSYLGLQNVNDPMSILKDECYDTYNFLRSLQDGLTHIKEY